MNYRQGDVCLVSVTDLPANLEELFDPRGVVLAEGETSGHYHGVVSGNPRLYRRGAPDARYLTVDHEAEIRVIGGGSGGVERHTAVVIAPGNYRVVTQRRWDVATATSAQVSD